MNTETVYKKGGALYASAFLARYAKDHPHTNKTIDGGVITEVSVPYEFHNCEYYVTFRPRLVITKNTINLIIQNDSKTFLSKKLIQKFDRLGFAWSFEKDHVFTSKKKPTYWQIIIANYILYKICKWHHRPTTTKEKSESKTVYMFEDKFYESKEIINAFLELKEKRYIHVHLKTDRLNTYLSIANEVYRVELHSDGHIERERDLERSNPFLEDKTIDASNISKYEWYIRDRKLHEILPQTGLKAYIELVTKMYDQKQEYRSHKNN